MPAPQVFAKRSMRVRSASSPLHHAASTPPSGVRFALLLSLAAAVSIPVCVRHVDADVDRALLGLGARALKFPGTAPGVVRTVEVNGIQVSIRGQSVDEPLESVLQHYERRCARGFAGASPVVHALAALSSRSDLREDEGYVACVDVQASDLGALVQRLRRFAQTWNLQALGSARYVYAMRSVEHPSSSTFVVAVWADGPLELRRALPLDGADAPGKGIEGAPRPPDSQRLLSIREVSRPSAAVVYEARTGSPSDLLSRQRAELVARGWSILERSAGEEVRIDHTYVLAAAKHERLLTVLTHQRRSGGSFVIHLEAGAP